MNISSRLSSLLKQSFVVLTFFLVSFYTYAYFFVTPYAGFSFSGEGEIVAVFVPGEPGLQVNDQLLQVGDVSWSEFRANLWQTFFQEAEPGEQIPIRVGRGEQEIQTSWTFPGITRQEFLSRLNSSWWLAYVFWILGTLNYLLVRPKDIRWRLLIAFNFLTALWLAAGGGPSGAHTLGAALVLRSAVWLCVPIYWHLHWVFPRPLLSRRIPIIVTAVYGGAVALAVAEWFQLLPKGAYIVGFLLAISGSVLLLLAQLIWQKQDRKDLLILFRIVGFVTLPIVVTVPLGLVLQDLRVVALALLGLPLIPVAYMYAISRHQLGRLQVRTNRLIVVYLYLILLSSGMAFVFTILANVLVISGLTIVFGLVATAVSSLITIAGFDRFSRFVEHYVLGIPLPQKHVLENYATQIATNLDKSSLAELIEKEILPSLLVRQSAILYLDRKEQLTLFLCMGIQEDDLPVIRELGPFFDEVRLGSELAKIAGWARCSIPLKLQDRLIGVWLLGARDPDDTYPLTELPMFTALAAQTAVALTNILQAENLHQLYRANVARHESERNQLALELHDELLNQMALLAIYVDDECIAPQFHEIFESLTTHFRRVIKGLRPGMLNYGLWAALQGLVDDLSEREMESAGEGDPVQIELDVPMSGARYPEPVEQHVYRIVQQSAENALRHAQASTLQIQGRLTAEEIYLVIADDGVGFETTEPFDLATLLNHRHFGLAGIYERAALIGAKIGIDSGVAQGTQVKLSYVPQKGGETPPSF